MAAKFRPMLACSADGVELKFPVMVSPKLDGIRCLIIDGVAYSRNMKPIRNRYIQDQLQILGKECPYHLDGELIVGSMTGEDTWNRSNSGVMRADGEPDFCYYVFDLIHPLPEIPYRTRYKILHNIFEKEVRVSKHWLPLIHVSVNCKEMLDDYAAAMIDGQFEGAMVRCPNGPYKQGRSTAREKYLLKVKFFNDEEFLITGVNERMHNANEATVDALGYTERSTHKANMVPTGTLGAFTCQREVDGELVTFEVGTGLDDAMRAQYWASPPIGKYATVRFQGYTKDKKPRFPSFKGIREDL